MYNKNTNNNNNNSQSATAHNVLTLAVVLSVKAIQLLFAYSIHLDSNRVYKNNNAMRHSVFTIKLPLYLYKCVMLLRRQL